MEFVNRYCDVITTHSLQEVNFLLDLIPAVVTTIVTCWTLYNVWKPREPEINIRIKIMTSFTLFCAVLTPLLKVCSDIVCFIDNTLILGIVLRQAMLFVYVGMLNFMIILFIERLHLSFINTAYEIPIQSIKLLKIIFGIWFIALGFVAVAYWTKRTKLAVIGASAWHVVYSSITIILLYQFTSKLSSIATSTRSVRVPPIATSKLKKLDDDVDFASRKSSVCTTSKVGNVNSNSVVNCNGNININNQQKTDVDVEQQVTTRSPNADAVDLQAKQSSSVDSDNPINIAVGDTTDIDSDTEEIRRRRRVSSVYRHREREFNEKEKIFFKVMSKYTLLTAIALISTLLAAFGLIISLVVVKEDIISFVDFVFRGYDSMLNAICLSLQMVFADNWFNKFCSCIDNRCQAFYIRRAYGKDAVELRLSVDSNSHKMVNPVSPSASRQIREIPIVIHE